MTQHRLLDHAKYFKVYEKNGILLSQTFP